MSDLPVDFSRNCLQVGFFCSFSSLSSSAFSSSWSTSSSFYTVMFLIDFNSFARRMVSLTGWRHSQILAVVVIGKYEPGRLNFGLQAGYCREPHRSSRSHRSLTPVVKIALQHCVFVGNLVLARLSISRRECVLEL